MKFIVLMLAVPVFLVVAVTWASLKRKRRP